MTRAGTKNMVHCRSQELWRLGCVQRLKTSNENATMSM